MIQGCCFKVLGKIVCHLGCQFLPSIIKLNRLHFQVFQPNWILRMCAFRWIACYLRMVSTCCVHSTTCWAFSHNFTRLKHDNIGSASYFVNPVFDCASVLSSYQAFLPCLRRNAGEAKIGIVSWICFGSCVGHPTVIFIPEQVLLDANRKGGEELIWIRLFWIDKLWADSLYRFRWWSLSQIHVDIVDQRCRPVRVFLCGPSCADRQVGWLKSVLSCNV
jgi:hypothetical protein